MSENLFGILVVGVLAVVIYWNVRRDKIKDERADLYSDGCSSCYQALHRRCRALVPSLAVKYQLPSWLVVPYIVDGNSLMGDSSSEARCRHFLSMRDGEFEDALAASIGADLREISDAYRQNPLPIWAEASSMIQSILLEKSDLTFVSMWDREYGRYGSFSPVNDYETRRGSRGVADEPSPIDGVFAIKNPSKQWLDKTKELERLRKFDQVWDSRDAEYLAEKMLMVQYPKSLGRPPIDIWSEEVQDYFQRLLDLRPHR